MHEFIMEMFKDFERYTFPEWDCTIQNKREPEIFDSESIYLCVIVDDRFKHFHVDCLRPYMCFGSDGTKYYGWAQVYSDGWIDHCERSVHDDHERVVAWHKASEYDIRDVFGVKKVVV